MGVACPVQMWLLIWMALSHHGKVMPPSDWSCTVLGRVGHFMVPSKGSAVFEYLAPDMLLDMHVVAR